MAVKLKSVFRNPSWSLKLKAFVYAFLMWWLRQSGAGGDLLPPLFFIGAASFFYFSSFFQGIRFIASFAILILLSFLAAYTVENFYSFTAIALLASFLFYALIAMKEYFFVHRQGWYAVLNLILAVWAGLFVFSFSSRVFFLGAIYFFLMLEYFLFNGIRERVLLFAFGASLILYQFIWALALFPIGFISQAAIVSLFYYAGRELIFAHFSGRLSRNYALRWATLIILFSTAIFLGSKWTI